jgi:DNA-binding response OmpR family regulator
MKILALNDTHDSVQLFIDHLRQSDLAHTVVTDSWPAYDSELLEETDFILLNFKKSIDFDELILLRHATKLPILIIAPIQDEATLVSLYIAGIDDHLVQPVSYPLLDAKLRVWQRWVERLASILYN